jgi:hypothetical protein
VEGKRTENQPIAENGRETITEAPSIPAGFADPLSPVPHRPQLDPRTKWWASS